MEGREFAALAPQLDRSLAVDRRVAESGKGRPERLGYFIAERELHPVGDGEDEGPNNDEPGKRRAGPDIGQNSEQGIALELPADFFEGFPEGGVAQVLVGGVESSARQSDVTRPGITLAFGSADEKDGVGVRGHDD